MADPNAGYVSRADYERDRERAQEARRESAYLRDLYKTATCGLGHNYGTRTVSLSVARRVADTYLVWADEYDAAAAEIEQRMEAMFSG